MIKAMFITNVGTHHVHTGYSVGSIFGLYHWSVICSKPVSQLLIKLIGDKLCLTEVVIPCIVAVAQNYVTKLYLNRKREMTT